VPPTPTPPPRELGGPAITCCSLPCAAARTARRLEGRMAATVDGAKARFCSMWLILGGRAGVWIVCLCCGAHDGLGWCVLVVAIAVE
jgi:hypothetical protein